MVRMIKKVYIESFATLYEARFCILVAVLIYSVAILTGWLFSDSFPFLEKQMRELTKEFINKSAPIFILKIFIRNLVASYIVACAISLWGLFPVFAAAANGLLLGWIVAVSAGSSPRKLPP